MIRFGTPVARRVIAATVLGSGIAFLDGTIVNVALPTIGEDLGTSLGGLQWIANAYLVTLSALLLLGGSLGDRLGRRRMFVTGLAGFTLASLLCGAAPNTGALIAARALQGVAAALLVPGSLSIIAATFHPDDRAQAIGAWSGLAGVTTSVGPFVGGWLIDSVSWRFIFFINVPLAAVAIVLAVRHVPETRAPIRGPMDVWGAALATLTLAAASYAAIEHTGLRSVVAAAVAAVGLVAFIVVEKTIRHPMLPLGMFRSTQFTGANLVTLAVYAGFGGAMFLIVLRLQASLGYSALEAGAAFVPFTVLLLVLSRGAGQLAQRIGARLPMTAGPLLTAAGVLLLSRVAPGTQYLSGVLPGVVVVGLGMSLTVAPLTAAVLAGADAEQTGVASGVNNAIARLGGLLAVAAIPAVAGIRSDLPIAATLDRGFERGLLVAAGLTAAGGLIAAALVRRTAAVEPLTRASVLEACDDPPVAADHRAT
ncbi:MAG: Uncharacterized MFS-type transporter [uncultured Acidimicrobiales bacterium]|uniref:Uncharacterized MFS-type transporter n=1 Tax=uncultured Acidimicrobiales bacterium TaxID=310071 RepID=A0A6J4I7P7_9ACTN|nr:MAG: Uncharacterized MFS-type transporter [uncultured Acidimicrobiales bacterium]